MEHGASAVECDSHARSTALRNFRSMVQQHGFNISPGDVGSLLENGFQHALVFSHRLNGITR